MTTPTNWASCLWCAFSYDDTDLGRLVDHQNGHIRALRDELQVVLMRKREEVQLAEMRYRELAERSRAAGEAMVSAGRELLDGAS